MSLALEPLSGKQKLSVQLATRRLNVWDGSVRSGKTIASILKWIQFVRHCPNGDLIIIGKTERTVKRNIVNPIIEMLGESRARFVEGAGEFFICGRRVYVVGANDTAAEGKIRGMTLVGAYVDEATLIPENMWRMLGTRLSVKGAKLFATTNPDNPSHWLNKHVLSNPSCWIHPNGRVEYRSGPDVLDLARFQFTLHDNPHLDAGYLQALEREYTGLWRRRFILGEWVIAEGAVYEEWDPTKHVVRLGDLPEMERLICVGCDYGTQHPFSAILLGLSRDRDGRGRLWALDEYRWDSTAQKTRKTSSEYSSAVRNWLAGREVEWVYVDPAAADFRRQLWADGVMGVQLAKNDVVPGIRCVSNVLSAGRLFVAESCTGLIGELPGYCWDSKAAEKGDDKPIKVNDDSCDALRYAVYSSQWIWGADVMTLATAA